MDDEGGESGGAVPTTCKGGKVTLHTSGKPVVLTLAELRAHLRGRAAPAKH